MVGLSICWRWISQTEFFKKHIALLEKHLSKEDVIDIVIGDAFKAQTPQNVRKSFHNLNWLSEYIQSIPSLKEETSVLPSILKNEGGLWHMSQMEIGSKDNPGSTLRFASFLENYTGDKRAFINVLKEEDFMIMSDIFTIIKGKNVANVYNTFKSNIKVIEDFIDSTPGFEGQGKMMIANGLKTGTFNPSVGFFKIRHPFWSYIEIREKQTVSSDQEVREFLSSENIKERLEVIIDLFFRPNRSFMDEEWEGLNQLH